MLQQYFLIFCCFRVSLQAFPPLPPPNNFTAHLLNNAKSCQMYRCAQKWSNQTSNKSFESLDSHCGIDRTYEPQARFSNVSFSDFAQGRVSFRYMVASFNYFASVFCNTDCGVSGYVKMTALHMKQRLLLGFARLNGAICYVGWDEQADFCWWNGFVIVFLFFFACIATPTLFILQFINAKTLCAMLGRKSGACLYLHLAETFTDFGTNIVVLCVDCLLMSQAAYVWQISCQNHRFIALYAFGYAVKRFLVFWNQCFLTSLLVDRLYACMDPHAYNNSNQKRRAKIMLLSISCFAFVLYLPLLLMHLLSPLLNFWETSDLSWGQNWPLVKKILTHFFTAAPAAALLAQIILGGFVERKFTALMRSSAQIKSHEAKKKRRMEKEKRLLLAGTVGLNLCTGTVSLLTHMVNQYALQGVNVRLYWYINLLWLFDPLLTFVNGSGGLIFHVVLCKTYRKAFVETVFGKLCCWDKQENSTTHSSKVSEPAERKNTIRRVSSLNAVRPRRLSMELDRALDRADGKRISYNNLMRPNFSGELQSPKDRYMVPSVSDPQSTL